ncbi:MAG TPA: hydrogenase maturation protease [Acidobacteriaceae bacterium]|nr:hydrogenase maturation protease [Acidobacteriaceae bacterium]
MNSPAHPRILVACIGNIFLGDDGFGCEVARTLAAISLPPEATVIDFGIRAFDLAFALIEPYQTIILVDTIARGSQPGTVYVLQPAMDAAGTSGPEIFDPHSMDPARLLRLAQTLGEITAGIYIVGCEPLDFGEELEGRMGLSQPVHAAVPEAAAAVIELIQRAAQTDSSAVRELSSAS